MATVETVTGPLDASELGTTLIHEHLRTATRRCSSSGPGEDVRRHPGARDRAGRTAMRRSRRRGPRSSSGVRTIADPTVMFSAATPLHARCLRADRAQVVAATGIYTYDYLLPFFVSRDPDQIAELFVSDIETGIQGTGAKAAFIKCAADEPG